MEQLEYFRSYNERSNVGIRLKETSTRKDLQSEGTLPIKDTTTTSAFLKLIQIDGVDETRRV